MAASNFSIFCSFCDSEFMLEKDLMGHLMMCGNKTDQCPKCEKYVRRAIFAYHYENNCTDPDALEKDDEIQQTPLPKRTSVSVKCGYCNQNYKHGDGKLHRANCLRDSLNGSRHQQQFIDEDFIDDADESSPSDDYDGIPCEWCLKAIPFDQFERHAIACRDVEHRRLEKQLELREKQQNLKKPGVISNIASSLYGSASEALGFVKCVFCGSRRTQEGLDYHQINCKKNPRRSGAH